MLQPKNNEPSQRRKISTSNKQGYPMFGVEIKTVDDENKNFLEMERLVAH